MLFFADLRCQVDEGAQNMLVIQFTTFHVEVAKDECLLRKQVMGSFKSTTMFNKGKRVII